MILATSPSFIVIQPSSHPGRGEKVIILIMSMLYIDYLLYSTFDDLAKAYVKRKRLLSSVRGAVSKNNNYSMIIQITK